MSLPKQVSIIEVGARDGLQNEAITLPVDVRVELIERLVKAGIKTIEAGSFVSPKWVPQMDGTNEVLEKLNASSVKHQFDAKYSVLTPNLKGLEGAIQHRADEVAIFGSASEVRSSTNNCFCLANAIPIHFVL